jgi:hypothetical protein
MDGMPLKRIAAEVGVSVSSVHAWTADIELTAEQKDTNQRGPGGPQHPEHIRRRAAAWAARCRLSRLAWQEDGRREVRKGDPLHLAGCMLYWAEGAKSKNRVKLVNSDPHLIATFRRFLTDALEIDPAAIYFSINVYTGNGLSIGEIEEHWLLGVLNVPRTCARKHTLNHMPTSSSGRSKNKLPYGYAAWSSTARGPRSTYSERFRSTRASRSLPGWASTAGRNRPSEARDARLAFAAPPARRSRAGRRGSAGVGAIGRRPAGRPARA